MGKRLAWSFVFIALSWTATQDAAAQMVEIPTSCMTNWIKFSDDTGRIVTVRKDKVWLIETLSTSDKSAKVMAGNKVYNVKQKKVKFILECLNR